jgi:hypothetical protein
MDQIERKLLDKFENVIQGVGKLFEQAQTSQRTDMQDVRKQIERSQSALEGKVEYIFAQMSHEQTQNMREVSSVQDVKSVMANIERIKESVHQATNGSSQQVIQEGKKNTLQLIQESNATAHSFETRLNEMHEMQSRMHIELEQKLLGRFDDSMENFRCSLMQQAQEVAQHTRGLQASMDIHRTNSKDNLVMEQSLLEQKFTQIIKELNADYAKSVEVGIGVLGNSLRLQLESVQVAQLAQGSEVESSLTSKLDSKIDGLSRWVQQQLTLQSQKHMDKIGSMLDTNISDATERAARNQLDSIRDLQDYLEQVMTSLGIRPDRSVRARTSSLHAEDDSRRPKPQRDRPSTAGNRSITGDLSGSRQPAISSNFSQSGRRVLDS